MPISLHPHPSLLPVGEGVRIFGEGLISRGWRTGRGSFGGIRLRLRKCFGSCRGIDSWRGQSSGGNTGSRTTSANFSVMRQNWWSSATESRIPKPHAKSTMPSGTLTCVRRVSQSSSRRNGSAPIGWSEAGFNPVSPQNPTGLGRGVNRVGSGIRLRPPRKSPLPA